MTILYRSTGDEKKEGRPVFFAKLLCLHSLLQSVQYVQPPANIVFINDGHMPNDRLWIMQSHGKIVSLEGIGNSQSYRVALDMALQLPDDQIVYFAEDDYLYTPSAFTQMLDLFRDLPVINYVTPYDHPDRYTRTDDARGGFSRVYIAGGMHFRTVESTCMTYGARVKSLRSDAWIHRLFTKFNTPRDRGMWRMILGLKQYGLKFPKRTLVGPIPSLATHMVSTLMAPNVDWQAVSSEVLRNVSLSERAEELPIYRESATTAE